MLDQTDELHLFALHFVFIPRINNLLSRWTESYNRHPLGTEHNSTPRQLWIESMLHLQNSHHTAPRGVFQRDLVEGPLEQFGIDWKGPCADCEDGESDLTVPGINVNLPPKSCSSFNNQSTHWPPRNYLVWTFIYNVYICYNQQEIVNNKHRVNLIKTWDEI